MDRYPVRYLLLQLPQLLTQHGVEAHNLLQCPCRGGEAHEFRKETTLADILVLRPVGVPLPVNAIEQCEMVFTC